MRGPVFDEDVRMLKTIGVTSYRRYLLSKYFYDFVLSSRLFGVRQKKKVPPRLETFQPPYGHSN